MRDGAVLVVEDDAVVRTVVAEVLGGAGMRVVDAATVADAATLAALVDVAVVVTDDHLPDGSGSDVMAAVRARDPGVPGLLLSTTPPSPLPPGVSFLGKPFGVTELLDAVGAALGAAPPPG